MNLKKYLIINESGQAALEYFIIFGLIATLTILSFSYTFSNLGAQDEPTGFLSKVRKATQGYFQAGAGRILQ